MLHFSTEEFADRRAKLTAALEARQLDAILLFAPESHFWLTGYDTFGYCFFQCLVVDAGAPVLLTRSADLRQAQLTSNIGNIRIWKDGAGVNPADDLKALLAEKGLLGKRIGVEFDTHGLTAANGRRLEAALDGTVLTDASDIVSTLRLIKSPAEIAFVRRAATLADDALDAGLAVTGPGADESAVLNAMQGAVLAGGGDYPGNEFIVGSGENALLCRYASGRRLLQSRDQLTLEWAGVWRHYHVARMNTVIIGEPRRAYETMHAAARNALLACEAALRPGAPMGDVFEAHARTLDECGLGRHRLNACGYSLGARFSPSWMEHQMFYEGAETIMQPGMVFFLHMILMDSDSGAAMTLGRTSLVTGGAPEVLSRHDLEMLRA